MRLRILYNTFMTNMKNVKNVLGMNQRNLDYIYPNNPRKYFEFANNKLLTKKTLKNKGIKIPNTFFSVSSFFELKSIESNLRKHSSFVIKPSSGSGGNGIIVICAYKNEKWISISGKIFTLSEIKKHIADIIFGVYSFGLNDVAIIEERIVQDEHITNLSPQGLADVRIINYKGVNVKAMLRIATKASDGKANLHQGGIGVSIDLNKGVTLLAQIERENITHHPDTKIALLNIKIPFWKEVIKLSQETSKIIPMDYLGIDIALSKDGPMVLEVNARPGIEIQNIASDGMIKELDLIDKRLKS